MLSTDGQKYRYTRHLLGLASCSPTTTVALLCEIATPLRWHPDGDFARYIADGISQGFRVGFDYSSEALFVLAQGIWGRPTIIPRLSRRTWRARGHMGESKAQCHPRRFQSTQAVLGLFPNVISRASGGSSWTCPDLEAAA